MYDPVPPPDLKDHPVVMDSSRQFYRLPGLAVSVGKTPSRRAEDCPLPPAGGPPCSGGGGPPRPPRTHAQGRAQRRRGIRLLRHRRRPDPQEQLPAPRLRTAADTGEAAIDPVPRLAAHGRKLSSWTLRDIGGIFRVMAVAQEVAGSSPVGHPAEMQTGRGCRLRSRFTSRPPEPTSTA